MKNEKKILNELLVHGFAILDDVSSLEAYYNLCVSLGEIIEQEDTVDKEWFVRISNMNDKQITKLGFSTKELFPHTDRSIMDNPPDILCLLCVKQAKSGGESLLVDMREIYQNENYQNLLDCECLFSDERRSRFALKKIFQQTETGVCARFRRDNFVYVSPEFYHKYEKLSSVVRQHILEKRLTKDQVLIVNNKRTLHGRKEFLGSRALLRVHIKSNLSMEI